MVAILGIVLSFRRNSYLRRGRKRCAAPEIISACWKTPSGPLLEQSMHPTNLLMWSIQPAQRFSEVPLSSRFFSVRS
jgi:hypothetical protein